MILRSDVHSVGTFHINNFKLTHSCFHHQPDFIFLLRKLEWHSQETE